MKRRINFDENIDSIPLPHIEQRPIHIDDPFPTGIPAAGTFIEIVEVLSLLSGEELAAEAEEE